MHRTVILAAAFSVLLGGTALAEESCKNSGPTLSKSDIEKKLTEQGYVKIRGLELHNGCYEAKGFEKSGKRFELEIDASTGEVVTRE
jgi:uncharacterized membrane protein YkoI